MPSAPSSDDDSTVNKMLPGLAVFCDVQQPFSHYYTENKGLPYLQGVLKIKAQLYLQTANMNDFDNTDNDPTYLARVLQEAARDYGCALGDITVLNLLTDPYRCATPNNLRDGAWVAAKLATTRARHIRGLHYAVLGQTKPDGLPYSNTQEDYEWLSIAVTQARWQGVIPFESLSDNRADPPTIYRSEVEEAYGFVSHGLPRLNELNVMSATPHPVRRVIPQQRYILAIFGEKSSLGTELRPVAERFGADLYLATGELSVTQAYLMARDAANDSRELVLFTVADFDPSGHQMTVSIARKLRALKDLKFPDLEYRVLPVALTLEQCAEFNLPSEALKKGEPRKDRWRAAMGREQTEVDALLGLHPGALADIVGDAIWPYYDGDVNRRARELTEEWRRNAQAAINAVVTPEAKALFTQRYDAAIAARTGQR
jgi:hypothetical protein